MKGLLKYISPFSPDQSGAVSVLYELCGAVVICDAGGCAGNICGFDEPRWFLKKSAVFSAGLRDMDAILGRDEHLVSRLSEAAFQTNAAFTAVIGTPVPAVIATDLNAIRRMTQKRTNKPSIAIDTDGTKLYDVGQEKAYLEVFRTFAKEKYPVKPAKAGVIGVTPLDFGDLDADKHIAKALGGSFSEVVCYGFGSGLEEIEKASGVSVNIVVSPSGLFAAKYLKDTFGTPFEIGFPLETGLDLESLDDKKILVIHQQFAANAVRERILSRFCGASVTVGTWFSLKDEYKQPDDVKFSDEESFCEYIENNNFDVMIADAEFSLPFTKNAPAVVDFPHYAVSGRLW